ncbi:hypothetical protein B0H14DRAFT_2282136, partial [Mycena olivaceomarginata]
QDFALVRTGEPNAVTDDTALEGLRVAQVRAAPLAYVEWFTPFSCREAGSDLFVVRRSTRQH